MNNNLIISISAFLTLSLLWLVFALALVFNRQTLTTAWRSFNGWPLIIRALIVLLALPLVLSVWIWNTRWPVWLRLALVVGLAWFTEYTFFPAAIFTF